MKNFLPYLLFFFSTTLSAQHVEWSVNVAPTISYRTPQIQHASARATTIQAGEKPMHTFDFGLGMRAAVNDRLKIGTAILYSQKGFSNTHVSAAYDDYKIDRTYIIDYIQDYLEIPFLLTYSILKKEKVEIYPLFGISNSLLLSDKNNVAVRSGEISEEIKSKISDPYLTSTRQHNLGLLFGWGTMARVDAKSYLGVEAQGKWMLTPLEDKVSVSRRHLYSLGLSFRFIRSLN